MLRYGLFGLLISFVFLAGCQQTATEPEVTEPVMVEEPPVVETTPEPAPPRPRPAPVVAAPSPCDSRTVYFEFDRSDVRSDARALVEAHAQCLDANPNQSVRLEGHADERGSREYNIGLGERRAQAVRQALMLLGVSGSRIETRSYGEEQPAVRGTGEFTWQQNRRVEIVYLP